MAAPETWDGVLLCITDDAGAPMGARLLRPPKATTVTVLHFLNWLRQNPDELETLNLDNTKLSKPKRFADFGLKLLACGPEGNQEGLPHQFGHYSVDSALVESKVYDDDDLLLDIRKVVARKRQDAHKVILLQLPYTAFEPAPDAAQAAQAGSAQANEAADQLSELRDVFGAMSLRERPQAVVKKLALSAAPSEYGKSQEKADEAGLTDDMEVSTHWLSFQLRGLYDKLCSEENFAGPAKISDFEVPEAVFDKSIAEQLRKFEVVRNNPSSAALVTATEAQVASAFAALLQNILAPLCSELELICMHELPVYFKKPTKPGSVDVALLHNEQWLDGLPVAMGECKRENWEPAVRQGRAYSVAAAQLVAERKKSKLLSFFLAFPFTATTIALELHILQDREPYHAFIPITPPVGATTCKSLLPLLRTLLAGVAFLIKKKPLAFCAPCPFVGCKQFSSKANLFRLGPRVVKLYDDEQWKDHIRPNLEIVKKFAPYMANAVDHPPGDSLLPGNFKVLAYDYIESVPINATCKEDIFTVLRAVAVVLDEMHDKQYVHGDVRATNMLAGIDENGKVCTGYLIDFDMARDLRNHPNYPDRYGTDPELLPERHPDAQPSAPMKIEHDRHSFRFVSMILLDKHKGRPSLDKKCAQILEDL